MESNASGNADVLSDIQVLASKHDKTLQKILMIKITTEATAKQIKSLNATVQQLAGIHKEAVNQLESELQRLREESLKTSVHECRRYSWNWCLKLHGVAEKDGEDVRSVVINTLGKVTSGIADRTQNSIDVAHHLGPKQADGTARSIIILFSLRRTRDLIWNAAKCCKCLTENRLHLSEPLSPEDRAARERLWPLVRRAKRQFFAINLL